MLHKSDMLRDIKILLILEILIITQVAQKIQDEVFEKSQMLPKSHWLVTLSI